MATSTDRTSGHEAILLLAREFRTAVRERDEGMEQVLRSYNGAFHDRINVATALLQGIQHEDGIYERASKAALQRYRATVDGDAEQA